MNLNLSGKRALVTGSTQGIGYAIAQQLIEEGAQVYIHCSRDIVKAQRICAELGGYGAVVADLCSPTETDTLHTATGDVDILVLNASLQIKEDWRTVSDGHFSEQCEVNMHSSLKLMQSYIPGMKSRRWGRVVTVGSVQQWVPHPQMTVYAATKSAVASMVRSVAGDVAPYGVTVNNVAPGVILTPRNDEALSDPAYMEQVLRSIPVGFCGEGKDVAPIVALLCSDSGRYITGADIPVTGGKEL